MAKMKLNKEQKIGMGIGLSIGIFFLFLYFILDVIKAPLWFLIVSISLIIILIFAIKLLIDI